MVTTCKSLRLFPISRRQAQLGLALMLAFFICWDLRAIFNDHRITMSDSTLFDALDVEKQRGCDRVLALINTRKGPLTVMLVMALDVAIDEPMLAARLLGILLHSVLLWMLYRIGSGFGRSYATGLLAPLICACYPGEFGFFRLDYHETLTTVLTLLNIWLLAVALERRTTRMFLALGVVVGLGLLSKVAFPLFVFASWLGFIALRVRSRGEIARLGLSVLVALILFGWWLLPNMAPILKYLDMSRSPEVFSIRDKIHDFLMIIPGSILLLGGAPLGMLLALRTRVAPSGILWLTFLGLLGGEVLLVFYFDSWTRYMLPGFPLAGLLCALGIEGLGRLAQSRVPARLLQGLVLAGVSFLLGSYCYMNIHGIPRAEPARELEAGMVSPDRHVPSEWPEAISLIRRQGFKVLEGCVREDLRGGLVSIYMSLSLLWERRGWRVPRMEPDLIQERLARRQPLHLLLIHGPGLIKDKVSHLTPVFDIDEQFLSLLKQYQPHLVRSFLEANGLIFSVIELEPRKPGS